MTMRSSIENWILPLLFFICVSLFYLGQSSESYWGGIFIPILAVFFIGFFFRLKSCWLLRRLNGYYYSYNKKIERLNGGEKYIEYSFWNLIRLNPILIAHQKSKSAGDWDSQFYIPELNPLLLTGFYEYTKSGSGKKNVERKGKAGDWGVHTFHLHPDKNYIHVKATAKSGTGENIYLLIKETTDLSIADDYLTNLMEAIKKGDLEELEKIEPPKDLDWNELPFLLRIKNKELLMRKYIKITKLVIENKNIDKLSSFKLPDDINVEQLREHDSKLVDEFQSQKETVRDLLNS